MAAGTSKRGLSEEEIIDMLFDSEDDGDCSNDGDSSELSVNDESDSDGSSEAELEQESPRVATPKRPRMEDWIWAEDDTDEKVRKIPFSGSPGLKRRMSNLLNGNPSALETLNALLGSEIWETVSDFTNAFAIEKQRSDPDPAWFATTPGEIKAYIALCILMSQVKKSSVNAYWSERSAISTPFFASVMPRKRFWMLSKYLHFCDVDATTTDDRLAKLRPIIDHVLKVFADSYSAQEDLAVDESLMKFRGRLAYVQFNPSKRARFGIKFYKLCESSSGYCLNFSIYTGKDTKSDATMSMLCSEAIVVDLLGDRLGDGHTVFLDNWYSSPRLFLAIKEGGSNAVGTVRTTRKNMPKELKAPKLAKGDCKTLFSRGIMAIQWQDRKPVTMLSTCHGAADITDTGKRRHKGNEPVLKPRVVQEYNKGMGGVDRQDQQLACFPIMRRYAKGYKKIFFYVLDMAIYNAYVLQAKKTGKKGSYTHWKVNLAEEIIEETALEGYRRRGRQPVGPSPMRLEAAEWAHFPRQIPPNPVKQNPSRQCQVCKAQGKKSESRWECEKCGSALHLPECFKIFHTRKNL